MRVNEYQYIYCTLKVCIFVQLNWRAVVVEYLLLLILNKNVSRLFWVSHCKVNNGVLHLPLVLPWPQCLHCVRSYLFVCRSKIVKTIRTKHFVSVELFNTGNLWSLNEKLDILMSNLGVIFACLFILSAVMINFCCWPFCVIFFCGIYCLLPSLCILQIEMILRISTWQLLSFSKMHCGWRLLYVAIYIILEEQSWN